MKLTRKLSLAIGLGICVVLAVHAWTRVELDMSDYRNDVRRDHDVTGRSLASAVELLWRTDGEARAREVVEELNVRTSNVTIRWVWPDGGDEAPRRADLVPVAGQPTRSEVVEDPSGTPFILSYTAVDLPGPRDGAVELYESLANERAHALTSLVRAGLTAATLIVVCGAITLVFGIVFVARPLRRLVEKAKRIGEGDLTGRVNVTQADEIRDVAGAMNEMCERLADTRERLTRESAAKIAAVEQVRHMDRLRTIGQLSSMMAHELGTPLNVVRGSGAMVARGELSQDRLHELGTVIVKQSDRMTEIIRGLLDYARRDPPNPYPTDLVRTVRQAVDWLRPIAHKRGLNLELDAEGELSIKLDPRLIQQALTNLIVNAMHASPSGESVRVRVVEDEHEARVEVIDRGPGVPQEDRDRLFEPFYTTKPVGEGTGLGLSIANEIVREHGGRIEIDGRPGDGATFLVHLPRIAA